MPNLGFGIIPLGPKTFPSFPTFDIISGVHTRISKSILPLFIVSIKSSDPTLSAPDAFASSTLSFAQMTATVIFFPFPWGRSTVVLKVWSAFALSKLRLILTSIDSTNLVFDLSFISLTASSIL